MLSSCPTFSRLLKGRSVTKLRFLRQSRAELDTQPLPRRRPCSHPSLKRETSTSHLSSFGWGWRSSSSLPLILFMNSSHVWQRSQSPHLEPHMPQVYTWSTEWSTEPCSIARYDWSQILLDLELNLALRKFFSPGPSSISGFTWEVHFPLHREANSLFPEENHGETHTFSLSFSPCLSPVQTQSMFPPIYRQAVLYTLFRLDNPFPPTFSALPHWKSSFQKLPTCPAMRTTLFLHSHGTLYKLLLLQTSQCWVMMCVCDLPGLFLCTSNQTESFSQASTNFSPPGLS